MRKSLFLVWFHFVILFVSAQTDSLTKTRFVAGLSVPEFLHIGVNVDLGKVDQLGVSAGIAPSWGELWPTLNVENRIYFGKISESTNRRNWFFRQSLTYFPAGNDGGLILTVGGDLRSKASNRGWTIDLGVFFLRQTAEDRQNKIYPAIRFQHYNYFRKGH